MIPDIPESNNWLYSADPYTPSYSWNQDHGYMAWNKYASAGGRLRGKKIVSSEAMTNTRSVFHTTLGTIKQADDMNFITGINHSVLHGFNYVPPDIPFPGLDPVWRLFQRTEHVVAAFPEVGGLQRAALPCLPEHEAGLRDRDSGSHRRPVGDAGLERLPFHLTPPYLHRLWEPISQLGGTCDYLHEGVIQKARRKMGC